MKFAAKKDISVGKYPFGMGEVSVGANVLK
jgi:hypothetical protein